MRDFDNRSNTNREFDGYYNNQNDNRFYNNYSSNYNSYDGNNDYSVNNDDNYRNDYYNNNYYDNSRYNYDERNSYNTDNINNSHNYQEEKPNRVIINKYKKISPTSIVIFIVFFAMFGFVFISGNSNNSELNDFIAVLFPAVFLLIFSLVTMSTTIFPAIKGALKRRRCKYQLKANIVDVRVKHGSKGRNIYIPTYQYFYMGNEYILTTRERNTFLPPMIGNQVDILINENKPEDYYIGSKKIEIITLLLGLIFTAVPVAICVVTAIANFNNLYSY